MDKKVFNFFDKIYCLNLDRRTDRWEDAKKEFKSIGILEHVERFSAIEKNPGWEGCRDSHIAIIEDAKLNKYKNVLVLEDDVKFINNVSKSLHKSIEELKKYKWYLFYLGATLPPKGVHPVKISDSLYQLGSALTTHAICYNSNVYDIFLDLVKDSMDSPVDVFLNKIISNHPSLICNPIVATQRESYSDIENKVTSYEQIEEYAEQLMEKPKEKE
jgi:glycosyl transferase family 25